MKKNHTLWEHIYRPETLEGYIGNFLIKTQLEKYIKKQDIPNLIFHGIQGTGKTTAAKLLVHEINCDYLYLNASDDNGIDSVRGPIKNFASAASFKPLKIVIYDDCHNLTTDAQNALLNLIETYSKTTRFIFTTNHIGKIIAPLRSRCTEYKVEPPSMKDVAIRLAEILEKEEVTFGPASISTLVKKFYPDIRKCIRTIQECVNEQNQLDLSMMEMVQSSYLKDIVEILKKPVKSSWTDIRQILNDQDLIEYTEVFKYLYDHAEEFTNKKGYEETIFAIAQAQYQQYFVPDKEINAAEMFLKILNAIK